MYSRQSPNTVPQNESNNSLPTLEFDLHSTSSHSSLDGTSSPINSAEIEHNRDLFARPDSPVPDFIYRQQESVEEVNVQDMSVTSIPTVAESSEMFESNNARALDRDILPPGSISPIELEQGQEEDLFRLERVISSSIESHETSLMHSMNGSFSIDWSSMSTENSQPNTPSRPLRYSRHSDPSSTLREILVAEPQGSDNPLPRQSSWHSNSSSFFARYTTPIEPQEPESNLSRQGSWHSNSSSFFVDATPTVSQEPTAKNEEAQIKY